MGEDVSERMNESCINVSKTGFVDKYQLVGVTPLDIEGVGGEKSIIRVVSKAEDHTEEKSFYSKKYSDEVLALQTVSLYKQMREMGLPVPDEVEYYEDDSGVYVVATDMSEGGKYPVWSFSANMGENAYNNFFSINPNMGELIPEMRRVVDDLNEKGCEINCDVFAIRRSEGKLQVILLDIDVDGVRFHSTSNKAYVVERNAQQAAAFLRHVEAYITNNQEINPFA